MRVDSEVPLRVLLAGREILLRPGHPVDLPDEQARRVIARGGGKVRVVETPADPPSESAVVEPGSGRPVCWESADGSLHEGAAVLLGRVGLGRVATYWVGIEDAHSRLTWVHESRLRNRRPAEVQAAAERPICSRCGGPPPLRWCNAVLRCLRCEAAR